MFSTIRKVFFIHFRIFYRHFSLLRYLLWVQSFLLCIFQFSLPYRCFPLCPSLRQVLRINSRQKKASDLLIRGEFIRKGYILKYKRSQSFIPFNINWFNVLRFSIRRFYIDGFYIDRFHSLSWLVNQQFLEQLLL